MPRKPATPICYIIAGPNGAGKTTFATQFLPLYAWCPNFINADLIARAYSPFDPDAGLLRAGRTVLERIAEFTEASTDFAFETTLSGRAYVPLLHRMKKSGFRLHIVLPVDSQLRTGFAPYSRSRREWRTRRAGARCPPPLQPLVEKPFCPLSAPARHAALLRQLLGHTAIDF
jgi:hypothetical protein